jgi:transforming growth factor-beta-induced protein
MNEIFDLKSRGVRSLALALLAGMFLFASCSEDNDSPLQQDETLSEVISSNPDLSTFQTAVSNANGINELLGGAEDYTVFAPDNNAFSQYLNGKSVTDVAPGALKNIILNHMVAGKLSAADLQTGTLTTLGGATIQVTRQGDMITLNNGVNLLAIDLDADNGILHVVSEVMETQDDMGTIAEIVVNKDNLSTLEAILTSGNYDDLLNAASDASSDLTLFAPDNEAFGDLLELLDLDLADIPENVVRDILMYHLVGTGYAAGDLTDGAMVTTLQGEDIMVMKDGGMVTLNPGDLEAMVEEADLEATNGYVHQIDAVLIPPSVQALLGTVVEPAYFSRDFTTLVAAIVKADLLEAIVTADEITVFAPTNEAFENAGIDVEETDAETLRKVLRYHVLVDNVPAGDLLNLLESAFQAPANQVSAPTLLGNNYMLYFTLYNNRIYINGDTEVDPANIMTDNGTVHVLPENVLMPPSMTIAEIVQAYANGEVEGSDDDGEFNILLAALTRASTEGDFDFLAAVSNPEGNLTVFAPTDEAFMKLLNIANIEELEDIPVDVLSDILKYHVIVVPFFSKDLLNNNSPATLYSSISIEVTGNLMIRDRENNNRNANIIMADVLATNGVIHVIDEVLLPFDIIEPGNSGGN